MDNAAFQVAAGERVAVVGPNGSGKSTLLRMILGEVAPDHGRVRLAQRVKVAFYEQHPRFAPGATGRDALAEGAEAPPEVARELAEIEARLGDPALYESGEADDVLARYAQLKAEAQRAATLGADDEALAAILDGIGVGDLDRPVASLSGGERTRLFLARCLARADPEGLLILDEPTNHLDVETIEWLEEWLLAYAGAAVFVAHDRAFLDNVATRVLAFEDARLASYPGNYEAYERVREEDQARLAAQREREAKELARQKAVVEQFRHQKRFDGQMASRLKRLERYREAIDRTPDPLVQKAQLTVDFPSVAKSSQDVVRVRGLGKKYGERIVLYGLDLDVVKGDRLALVGANGAGKTTLLRILTGRERKDVGTVEVAPGVKGAYYAQGNEDLVPERTLAAEVLAARPGLEEDDVRALLGRFGFRHGYDPARKVQSLSGGERARLSILKTILAPSNLLVLDEPTNHLDLESRRALAGALNAYTGTIVLVSHDRWLLDSVATKVAVIARGAAKVFEGDFTQAREQAMMEAFTPQKPTRYLVKKGFKDYDTGARHAAGSIVELTDADLEAKRLWRTALSMGWMVEE
ncbi:MAG TPA: ABC-F family ATP-binding cassette domain-containing protein [Candidatus Thermoplasmatota archaeon]|nr:ABC-F family ATP-binding cassette domain-containing protein [Candidatus Thermoplasmatota archaeon]